jgi:hypothetical protein
MENLNMTKHTFCYTEPEVEALRDLLELEALVSQIPTHVGDLELQTEIFETVEQLQDLCPHTPHSSMIRKLVACFGDAYFFFNKTGNVCFLTDFMTEIKQAEAVLS